MVVSLLNPGGVSVSVGCNNYYSQNLAITPLVQSAVTLGASTLHILSLSARPRAGKRVRSRSVTSALLRQRVTRQAKNDGNIHAPVFLRVNGTHTRQCTLTIHAKIMHYI